MKYEEKNMVKSQEKQVFPRQLWAKSRQKLRSWQPIRIKKYSYLFSYYKYFHILLFHGLLGGRVSKYWAINLVFLQKNDFYARLVKIGAQAIFDEKVGALRCHLTPQRERWPPYFICSLNFYYGIISPCEVWRKKTW